MVYRKAIIKTIIASITIYVVLKISCNYLSPFLLAILISIIIEPVIKIFMDKLCIGRKLSIIIALLLFCFILFIILYYAIKYIYKETLTLVKNAPYFYGIIDTAIKKISTFLKNNFNVSIDYIDISSFNIEKIIMKALSFIYSFRGRIADIIYSIPEISIFITFSFFAAFFISRDKNIIINIINKYMPYTFVNIADNLYKSIIKVIKTQCVLISISTAMSIIGFMILGVEYAFSIGLICGALDILPLIGPGMVFIPWSFYNIIMGKRYFGVALLCLYIIIVVIRQILETKFISGRLEIHPLFTLLSIYIGIEFFGVLGALIGPIMVMIIKQIYLIYVRS